MATTNYPNSAGAGSNGVKTQVNQGGTNNNTGGIK